MPPVKITRRQTLNRLKRVIANLKTGLSAADVRLLHFLGRSASSNGLGFKKPRRLLTRQINIAFANVGAYMTRPVVDVQKRVYQLRDAIWEEIPKKHQSLP